MKHLLVQVMKANHNNVILISVLHRYDLVSNSCVNKEIREVQKEAMQQFGKTLESGNDRGSQ
jgi:hypothetical protein